MARANHEGLLETAYEQLGFSEAEAGLLSASDRPEGTSEGDWIEKGDWLSLAKEVGAEKIFFVGQNPVVVFARVGQSDSERLRRLYNRIWCMARPQLLFLARPGELGVYDLARPPVKPSEELASCDRLLDVARTTTEVQAKLTVYHREKIETGSLFGEKRFGDGLSRADRALIRDLKAVRYSLMDIEPLPGHKSPSLHHIHSLIGRAIFIRYLEDREVLTRDYFEGIASRRRSWAKLLDEPLPRPAIEPEMERLCFLRVLRDKDFTYALFDQLAEDFNGDTFPADSEERARVHEGHLQRLLGFLVGQVSGEQPLFFFAYHFDVIPIELISSIYEEFYGERKGKGLSQASHYTPPPLVEFILSETLTTDILAQEPRVMDPSCGSGIFLVESFRRMVRYRVAEQGGRRLTRAQLRRILRQQIAGIDINEEAIRVAAFSLYLAFLHYQQPREINEERRLPHLKWVPMEEREEELKRRPDTEFYDVLLHDNAFKPVSGGCQTEIAQRFGPACAHVVVGNPPWGYPKKDDREGHEALKVALEWCNPKQGRPIGDKELSQAFVHLTLALLRDGGKAGLLVSSGVLFKHHKNSRQFRHVWLARSLLRQVVNFAHVRHVYFTGPTREVKGIAPFISVVFEKVPLCSEVDRRFEYWSAKRGAVVESTQAVVLSKSDMHWLLQRDCRECDKLWKIYWWGGHHDEALIKRLDTYTPLGKAGDPALGTKVTCRQGFTEGTRDRKPSPKWFLKYRELPAERLVSYGPFDENWLVPVPEAVKRPGSEVVYTGTRLLIGRGVGRSQITARLETLPFSFRNSINAFRLEGFPDWQEKTLLGICWSSLTKYYFFMTIGSWLWHDEIHRENVVELPVRFPSDAKLRDRIVRVVEQLRNLDLYPGGLELGGLAARQELPRLEQELDDAVFTLYGLSESERDLIIDMCSVGLDLFYRGHAGDATKPVALPPRPWGTYSDIAALGSGLGAYLSAFLQVWNAELEPDGEFMWRVVSPPSGAPLLAVRFATRFKGEPMTIPPDTDGEAWEELLRRMEEDAHVAAGSSAVFTDTFFRVIGEREMLFIKRNEARLWTRTAAREDAEAALVALMYREQVQEAERK